MDEGKTPAIPARMAHMRMWITAHPVLMRWILAGPVTIIATLLVLAGMVFWVPEGAAKLNNVALPVILMPLVWAGIFFYACLDENLPRATGILLAVIIGHAILVSFGV